MPIDPATARLIGAVALKFGPKIRSKIFGKKQRPFSGTIDLGARTVDICTHHPKACARKPAKAAAINASLTAYLRGEGPAPGNRRRQYLVSQIDQVRDDMRVRPLTETESVAWGQVTPASKALAAYLPGARRGAGPKRRRAKKNRSLRRAGKRRARRATRSSGRKRLVRGSAAAKAWGRKMRRLRKR